MPQHKPDEDFIGKTFNCLTINKIERDADNNRLAHCLCKCGNTKIIKLQYILNEDCKSCGCLKPKNIDPIYYIGKKYHKLTIQSLYKENKYWIANCICDCGNNKIIRFENIKNEHTKSCGCGRSDAHKAQSVANKHKSKKDWSYLINQKINNFTVISLINPTTTLCKCDCGNQFEAYASHVSRNRVRMCHQKDCTVLLKSGLGWNPQEMVGKKYNKLTVTSLYRAEDRSLMVKCLCDCGNEKELEASRAYFGAVKTCGKCPRINLNTPKEGDLIKCKGRCGETKVLNDENFPRRADKSDPKEGHRFRYVCFYCRRKPPLTEEELIKLEEYKKQRKIETRLHSNLSRSIRYYCQKDGNKKKYKTKSYVPYTMAEFKKHIESQWEPWMNWENQGTYSPKFWRENDINTHRWQIDHINPASEFHYTSPEDQDCIDCWALSNLRPLSAKQNMLDGTSRARHKIKNYGSNQKTLEEINSQLNNA